MRERGSWRGVCVIGVAAIAIGALVQPATAASDNLTPKKDWLGDFGLGFGPSGFDVLGDGRMVAVNGADVNLYAADGTFTRKLTELPEGWGAWVRIDPTGQTVWFGYTTSGSVDDRIYTVPMSGDFDVADEKVHQATLTGNYDAEFASIGGQDRILVAGTDSTDWADPHCIWLLDTSGADDHDKLVELGGWSVGMAVDLDNSLVSTSAATNTMYRFDETDWLTAIGATELTVGDGTALTDLDGGNYDIAVDDVGNIFFNINGSASELAVIEAGKDYSGYGAYKYDVVAQGDPALWHWFINVDAEGDVVGAATLGRGYTADFYYGDVCYIPEPTALALLGLGLAFVSSRRRRDALAR